MGAEAFSEAGVNGMQTAAVRPSDNQEMVNGTVGDEDDVEEIFDGDTLGLQAPLHRCIIVYPLAPLTRRF